MAFSLFNFGVGLQGQDAASSVFDGVRARVEDLRETTNSYAASASRAFSRVGDNLEDLGRRAVGTFRQEFGQSLDDQVGKLEQFGRTMTFNMGDSFNQQALSLADTTKKLAVQFGEADDKASMFTNDIVEMSSLTGRSIDTFTNLANSLGQAGIDITDLSKATRILAEDGRTLQTTWGEQEYLATLIDAFGVAGDEVAEFAKGSKVLGLSIRGTLDDVTTFQRNFKMPGMIEQLPEATQSAIRAISDFGTEIAGSGKNIVANTLQMGAVFAKTFGRSMKESVQEAARTMQQFNQEQLGLRKIAVGLSTDFSPMVTTFLETGESLDFVRKKMRQAATDRFGPIKFAEYVRGVYDRLQTSGDAMNAERFLIQMREQAPEAAKRLIAIPGALESARKEMERLVLFEKNNKGLKTFQEIGNEMWSTGKVAIDVFKNLLTLSKTIVGLVFEPLAKDIFGSAGEGLKGFNDKLATMVKRVNDADGAFQKRWKPSLVFVGKAIVGIGTAATLSASALGGLLTALTIKKGVTTSWNMLSAVFPRVGAGGTKVMGVFKFLSKGAGFLAKKVLLPIMAVKSLVVGLMEMGKVFKDPNATGVEKFGAILRGLVVGVVDFADDLLFGLPSKLATTFFPSLGDSLEQGMGNIFDSAWAKVGNMFSDDNLDAAKQWIGNLFGRAGDWLASFDITKGTRNIVGGVTTAIVGIGKFASETIWSLVRGVFRGLGRWIKGWFSDEVTAPIYDESDVMWGKVAGFGIEALQKIKELGLGIMQGLWEGVANAAGSHVDFVNGQFHNMWLDAKLGYLGFENSFLNGFDNLEASWLGFKHSFGLFVPWIKKIGGEAWGGFAHAATGAFNTAVIASSKALQKFLKKIAVAISFIEPTSFVATKLAEAESALIDVTAARHKAQHKANQEHKAHIHALGVEYEKAADPLNKAIVKVNEGTVQRKKVYEAEVAQINRQINQNNLLGSKAQDAYKQGIRAEKQERKAASAFRNRKAAEERANAKSRTSGDQKKGAGKFADLWRMANMHAQDRVRNFRSSLERSGKTGGEADSAVSEASINELKRLTELRRAIKGGDPGVVKGAFDNFMSKTPRAKVSKTPSAEGSGSSQNTMKPLGSIVPQAMSSEPATPRAPLSNIVDSSGSGDSSTEDLVGRLADVGKEKRSNHREMIGRMDRMIEAIEESNKKGGGQIRVKLDLDKDRFLKAQKRDYMSQVFRENGVGG